MHHHHDRDEVAGRRSYLVHDGTVALVIDPQRDIDRVEQALAEAGVRLTHVAETHIHNDYVSGGLELASYYAHMSALNREGVDPVDLTVPAPVDPGHLAGTLSFEHGPMFTTFLGWVVPWGDAITLVGSEEQVTAAVRDLSRIGIDHSDVAIGQDVAALGDGLPMVSYPVVGWSNLVTARQAD